MSSTRLIVTRVLAVAGAAAAVVAVAAVVAAGASSAAPCVFVAGGPSTCTSSMAGVSVDFLNATSTVGCAFVETIDWGDGSARERVQEPGGEPGPTYLASHSYTSPGTYTISLSGSVTSGPCTISDVQFSYTQLPAGAPTASAPVIGQEVVLTSVSGTIAYRVPGSAGFVLLSGVVAVPNGTDVDATNGTVGVTVATGATPATQEALAYSGYFTIEQAASAPYTVDFALSQPLTGCVPASTASARPKPMSPAKHRQLWVHDTGGNFGSTGRYVSTTVEGTQWLTLDTCTASTVTVAEGLVAVHDEVDGQTVVVAVHGHYVASRGERAAGPLAAVDSYWAAVGAHEIPLAYGYVVPGVLGGKSQFVRAEGQEGVESATFHGKVTAQSLTRATIAVVSLVTRDHEFGCRRWSGHYTMRRRGSRWLIATAAIKHRACG